MNDQELLRQIRQPSHQNNKPGNRFFGRRYKSKL